MSPEPRVCYRALLCVFDLVMKKDYEDNVNRDLNFQNMLCISVLYLCIKVLLYGL